MNKKLRADEIRRLPATSRSKFSVLPLSLLKIKISYKLKFPLFYTGMKLGLSYKMQNNMEKVLKLRVN